MNQPRNVDTDSEQPLDLQRALALVSDAETKARKQLHGNDALIYLVWGVVWLLGFGALHGSRFDWLPLEYVVALSFAAAVMAVGVIATILLVAKHSSGVRGHSTFIGTVYGIAWMLGFAVVAVLSGTIGVAVDDFWVRGMLINSIAVLVVGLMYITGGAMFNDRTQIFMGAWFLIIDFIAIITGPERFLTVFFVFGSGGFLVGAAIVTLRQRRSSSHA
ncbi:hypothetical protein BJ994_002545 [Arthrobacter pigmenti]|uniref:Uncharacterized protein n=1 Tax=Arthrobacter pigmenti TaxID=271432 RepID=A0A846RQW5_9MICC|nr:hypothetical protein [Arthrobacter pigmenti]NJC23469.1 hypothetical protein [Arthrobacter pigmenti]